MIVSVHFSPRHSGRVGYCFLPAPWSLIHEEHVFLTLPYSTQSTLNLSLARFPAIWSTCAPSQNLVDRFGLRCFHHPLTLRKQAAKSTRLRRLPILRIQLIIWYLHKGILGRGNQPIHDCCKLGARDVVIIGRRFQGTSMFFVEDTRLVFG